MPEKHLRSPVQRFNLLRVIHVEAIAATDLDNVGSAGAITDTIITSDGFGLYRPLVRLGSALSAVAMVERFARKHFLRSDIDERGRAYDNGALGVPRLLRIISFAANPRLDLSLLLVDRIGSAECPDRCSNLLCVVIAEVGLGCLTANLAQVCICVSV